MLDMRDSEEAVHLEVQARPELVKIIEGVARDKGIALEEVFEAMEMAIKKVALIKYGSNYDIKVNVNRSNGTIYVFRVTTVVEDVEDAYKEVTLQDAQKEGSVLGDEILDELPVPQFSRSSVQAFRQIVAKKIKECERKREYELYKDKAGEIVSGIVKRVEFGNVFIELNNNSEAILTRENCIPRERLEPGSRVRALVLEIRQSLENIQIFLSRNHSDFIKKLFEQEVPEVYEEIVEIKAISRIAGIRTKIAVVSNDVSIDPISVCVGFKGGRIYGILNEVRGEKIDLVQWSESIASFVVNAFNPIQLQRIVVDEDKSSVDVIVAEENLGLSIGKGGVNINLISKLIGWKINVLSEETDKVARQQALQDVTQYFEQTLEVDEVIGQLLFVEGYRTVDDLMDATPGSLLNIPGFNEDIIEELKERCAEYKKNQIQVEYKELKELGISDSLIEFLNNDKGILAVLGSEEVLTLEDLGDLSAFDFMDLFEDKELNLSKEEVEGLIMKARDLLNNEEQNDRS